MDLKTQILNTVSGRHLSSKLLQRQNCQNAGGYASSGRCGVAGFWEGRDKNNTSKLELRYSPSDYTDIALCGLEVGAEVFYPYFFVFMLDVFVISIRSIINNYLLWLGWLIIELLNDFLLNKLWLKRPPSPVKDVSQQQSKMLSVVSLTIMERLRVN